MVVFIGCHGEGGGRGGGVDGGGGGGGGVRLVGLEIPGVSPPGLF